ncbi:MAG: acyl-CoA dehydrogenase family protein [Pseudomonadota bacterium]
MDLELSSEQQLIKESADRFVERDYPFNDRRAAAKSEQGFRPEIWKTFAELGWLGIGLPEDVGGFGGAKDVAILSESLGKGLVNEPFLASVVLGGGTLARAGTPAQQQDVLPSLVAGETLLAFAHGERQSRNDIAAVTTTAKSQGGGYRLDGAKSVVLNGDTADRLVVSARTAGGDRDEDGLSLFLVDTDAKGVSRRGYATNDGSRAAEIVFEGVEVPSDALIGEEGAAYPIIEETVDRGAAALCGEALGLMAALNDLTIDYSKTREQFGQPIGKFQALQHRMVDMFVALEEARSLTTVYMNDVDSDDRDERRLAVSAMKAQIGKSGRLVGQEAIQLHGGIGMTEEYAAGHYFKRLTIVARLFGDIDWHLERFAALS